MKADRLFRAFTPYSVVCEGVTPFERLTQGIDAMDIEDKFFAADPIGQSWGTIGLVPVTGDDHYFDDLDGSGFMLKIQFAKRQLPVRVIRIEADKMAEAVERTQARKVGRKEYREMMDDATALLLPKSHIIYHQVAVIITDKRFLIFNAAQGTVDQITSFLVEFFLAHGIDYGLAAPENELKTSVRSYMTSKAIAMTGDDEDTLIHGSDFAVMKASDESKGSIRVNNHTLAAEDVQHAIRQGYRIEQMAVYDSAVLCSYRLSADFRFRFVEFSDDFVQTQGEESFEDQHAIAWLVARTYTSLIDNLIKDIAANAETEDDDEM